MLDFIQAILNVVAKAVPLAISRKRDNRLSEIGAELFLFYIQVNEALVCAEDIVSSLEVYAARMSGHMEKGDDAHAMTAGDWISYKVARQCTNLARIGETMQRWGWPLQILEGESFAEITILLRGKRNALNSLLQSMQAMKLPLSVDLEELQAFVHEAQHADRHELFDKMDRLDEAIRRNSLSMRSVRRTSRSLT